MKAQLKTRVTEMLGIEYPIIQGCMQWISRAQLVGAVSAVGGLGILSSSSCYTAEELRRLRRSGKSPTSRLQ